MGVSGVQGNITLSMQKQCKYYTTGQKNWLIALYTCPHIMLLLCAAYVAYTNRTIGVQIYLHILLMSQVVSRCVFAASQSDLDISLCTLAQQDQIKKEDGNPAVTHLRNHSPEESFIRWDVFVLQYVDYGGA